MFGLPVNSSVDCTNFYQNISAEIPRFLTVLAITQCMEESEAGIGSPGALGVDLFLTAVANNYFLDVSQIMFLYDESWDITELLIKLEGQSKKSFVTYYIPVDKNLSSHLGSKPPDHITHKLLPKAEAIIMFVKDPIAFTNMLETIGQYPWWNKRAKFLILCLDKRQDSTKNILGQLEADKIFNGVVITEFTTKDNSTAGSSNTTQEISADTAVPNSNQHSNSLFGMEIQVTGLDPYPLPGHSKQTFVARWKGANYTYFGRPIFQEKIDNLRQNKLVAAVFEFPPLVIKTEVAPGIFEYGGQEVKIFQEFAKILNFTYEFYEPPEGEKWGMNLGCNNWTGLIGEIQNTADIGFASIFLLDNREQAVDVSHPYDGDQGCFAVPRPENLKNWAGLVLPFSWQVWACILAMAVVAGPIFTAITRPLKMDSSITLGNGIFYAFGSLISSQKAPKAKSHSLRTFIVCWLIFCWLAFILYRVSLIVALTTGPSNFKIDTVRQLVHAGLKWGGYQEVLKTFTNTTERDDQKLFERFEEITNITEALDKVAYKGNYAVLDSSKYLMYAANVKYFDGYNAGFHISKECPTRYNVGFAMPIGSPFLEKINELIRRFQSAGLIDKWLRDVVHEAAVKTPSMEKKRKKDRGLSLDNMKLCYIIFFCGHFCAFVACVLENLHKVYINRKDKIAEILAIARRLSIFSTHSHAKAPSVVITDVEGDSESLDLDDGGTNENNMRRSSIFSKPRKRRWSTISHEQNAPNKFHPAPDFRSDGEE